MKNGPHFWKKADSVPACRDWIFTIDFRLTYDGFSDICAQCRVRPDKKGQAGCVRNGCLACCCCKHGFHIGSCVHFLHKLPIFYACFLTSPSVRPLTGFSGRDRQKISGLCRQFSSDCRRFLFCPGRVEKDRKRAEKALRMTAGEIHGQELCGLREKWRVPPAECMFPAAGEKITQKWCAFSR